MRLAIAAAAIGCLTALLSPSPTALAQSQPFVAPTPGTRIVTNTTTSYEVDSAIGTTVRTVNNRLAVAPWLAACRDLGNTVEFDAAGADALWPLEVGKTAKSETRRNEHRWAIAMSVKGVEKITVPAGTFDTWLIEIEETATSHDFKAMFQCWYAPEVGFTVRRRHQVLVGTVARQNFDVVRIEKHDRSKVAAFVSPPPGTVFNTNIGSFTVTSTKGTDLFREAPEGGHNAAWIGGLHNVLGSVLYFDKASQAVGRIWPLEVGKKASFDHSPPSGGVWVNTLTVERVETIAVPAGTFTAFVVSWREQAINGTYHGVYRYWWAPALGFPIKAQVELLGGQTSRKGYVLQSVSLPK